MLVVVPLVVVMMVMGPVLEAVMSRLVTVVVMMVVMSLTELTCSDAHVGTARPTKADPVLA